MKKLLIILSIGIIIALIASFTIPVNQKQIPFETWGNNEHFYENIGGMKIICDFSLMGVSSNCQAMNENGEIIPWPNVVDFETAEKDKQIKRIDVNCKCQQEGGPCIQPLFEWENTTHYIDNNFCEFIEKPENCTGNMLSFINARSNIFNENADSVIWGDTNDSIIEKPEFMECVNQIRIIYGK